MELRQRYHTQENYDRQSKEKKEQRLLNAYRKAVSELTIHDEEREQSREDAENKLETMQSLKLELETLRKVKDMDIKKLRDEFREEISNELNYLTNMKKGLISVEKNLDVVKS